MAEWEGSKAQFKWGKMVLSDHNSGLDVLHVQQSVLRIRCRSLWAWHIQGMWRFIHPNEFHPAAIPGNHVLVEISHILVFRNEARCQSRRIF